MKRGFFALALIGLLVRQGAGETVLERASRALQTPGAPTDSRGISINYIIVIPEAAPWPGHPLWLPPPRYAYPYPMYPPPYGPPGSYWYAQVPLTPGMGLGAGAYPSPTYIFPAFRSAWAYGPTYIPSQGQMPPWYAPGVLPRREERSGESPRPTQPSPGRRDQEPARPTVVQAAQQSDEETVFLPLKRVALETSPPHPSLAIEALGNGRVKVAWLAEGDSELRSVEIGLLSPQGKVLQSASFSKPPYSATLRGDWRQARLHLVLRFTGGGTAEFTLPLREKNSQPEEASR